MHPTTLITGASSGIGQATAQLFAQNKHNLILTARNQTKLELLKSQLEKDHQIKVHTLTFDITDHQAIKSAITSIPTEFTPIQILINNAGLALDFCPIQNGNPADWSQMIDTNIKGLLNITKEILPQMISQSQGHIINLSSIAGHETYPNNNIYCATKHAVDSITKTLRLDLLPHNIKVTAISPGAVNTNFSTTRFKGDQQKAENVYKGYTPLKAQDIAECIYFTVTRPPHVNINDIIIMPTSQADDTHFHKV